MPIHHVLARRGALLCAALSFLACAAPSPAGDSASAGGSAPSPEPGARAARDAAAQGGVALALDRERYAAGATVRMWIVNGAGAGYGYNPCQRILERREGDTWRIVPEDRVCTMELRLLGVGVTVNETTELPSPLPPGEYRLALALSREEGPMPADRAPAQAQPVRATSPAFRVD